MKVLVVDDNQFLASTIQYILEDRGLEVMSASDGVEGYSAYLLFNPDLIITDIQMPRRNGIEMMECIRNHDPMIETIYMSGDLNSYLPYLEEKKKTYPIHFYQKPFPLDLLGDVISEPKPRYQQTCSTAQNNTCV